MKRYEKRIRLKREICFILGALVMALTILLLHYGVENYKEFLEKCDARTGHTCNIFGK